MENEAQTLLGAENEALRKLCDEAADEIQIVRNTQDMQLPRYQRIGRAHV